MKKISKKSIFVVILCMALCVGIAAAVSDSQLIQGERVAYEVGKEIEKSVHELLKMDNNATAFIHNDASMNESEIMGEVMGVKITKTYFNFKYDSFKPKQFNHENPKQEAWEAVIEQIWRQKFAEENNLMPTEAEIDQQTKKTRKDSESSQEGKIFIKSHCKGINLTEDEYWEFHRRYYAPLAVIYGKVAEYMEKNDVTMPDVSEIEAKIIDDKYFEELS